MWRGGGRELSFIAQLSQLCDLVFQKSKRVTWGSAAAAIIFHAVVVVTGAANAGAGAVVAVGMCVCMRVWVDVQLSVCV